MRRMMYGIGFRDWVFAIGLLYGTDVWFAMAYVMLDILHRWYIYMEFNKGFLIQKQFKELVMVCQI
jgi:hypothetical protein